MIVNGGALEIPAESHGPNAAVPRNSMDAARILGMATRVFSTRSFTPKIDLRASNCCPTTSGASIGRIGSRRLNFETALSLTGPWTAANSGRSIVEERKNSGRNPIAIASWARTHCRHGRMFGFSPYFSSVHAETYRQIPFSICLPPATIWLTTSSTSCPRFLKFIRSPDRSGKRSVMR